MPPWNSYSKPAVPFSPQRSQGVPSQYVVTGMSASGPTIQNPQAAAQMSGAQSAASTAASEAARLAAEKKALSDFIGQFVDPSKPLNTISAEEMLKAKGATPELVQKIRGILGLDQTDKAMSGEYAKVKEIAESGLRQVDALGKEIVSGNKLIGAALPFSIGDRNTGFIQDDLTDLIGRLRSGGAINKDEEERFQRLIPGWLDLNEKQKLYKLNELGQKFGGLAKTLKSDKSFVPFKPSTQGVLTPNEQARMEELMAKQASGTLQGAN